MLLFYNCKVNLACFSIIFGYIYPLMMVNVHLDKFLNKEVKSWPEWSKHSILESFFLLQLSVWV